MDIQTLLKAARGSASTYLFNVNVKNVNGHVVLLGEAGDKVRHARELATEYNKNRSPSERAIRIALNGRMGKNNPNAYKYAGRKNPLRVLLEDAQYAGVYVWYR